jgi:DNA repair protein RadC
VSDGHEDGARPPGYRLMLREMAPDERPREKLKLRGSAALSDGELLAIILNTGIQGETVTAAVRRLLAPMAGCAGSFAWTSRSWRGCGEADGRHQSVPPPAA